MLASRALMQERALRAAIDGSSDPYVKGAVSYLAESLSMFAAKILELSANVSEEEIPGVVKSLHETVEAYAKSKLTEDLIRKLSTRIKEIRASGGEAPKAPPGKDQN